MAQYNNSQNNVNINSPVKLSGAANVTATLTDYIIAITDTSSPRTVTLPSATTTGADSNNGKVYIIKDQSGGASANNITVSPSTGNIDGAPSLAITENYGELQVYSDGTAWYSSAGTEISGTLEVERGGTGTNTLTDGGILLGSGTNPVTPTAQPTNGQLLIGSSGTDPVLANLTQCAGMTITNGAGTVTLASTAVVWSSQGTGVVLSTNQGYFSSSGAAQNFSLPATAAIGDVFELVQIGTGVVTITQAAGQSIRVGNTFTTTGAGGSLASTQPGDSIKIVCTTANTGFCATSLIGNWNVN